MLYFINSSVTNLLLEEMFEELIFFTQIRIYSLLHEIYLL